MSDDEKQAGGEEVIAQHGQAKRAGDEAVFPDLKVGEAWGESITKVRAAELEQRLQAWEQETDHGERKGPFSLRPDLPVIFLTGADVHWLAAHALAGTSEPSALAEQVEHLRKARQDVWERHFLDLSALNLSEAWVGYTDLSSAALCGAVLVHTYLSETNLSGAYLDRANISRGLMGSTNLSGAGLVQANLSGALLPKADVSGANLREANLSGANLQEADLARTIMSSANLTGANLANAKLSAVYLDEANLSGANLDGADLSMSLLRAVRMSNETSLRNVTFSTGTQLADVMWNSIPLAQVTWDKLPVLGDERRARRRQDMNGKAKEAATRREEYESAARAYRLLAVALRDQGMNEHADRFAYRAQLMQRVVQRRRHQYLRYIGSLLLDLLAGYGYRPGRAILLYLAVIIWFANFYVWASHGLITLGLPPSHVQPLAWYEGLILSVSSFHGRGFQPFQNLNDPVAALAGIQAVLGLVIEVSFIATFTQRFFGK